MTIHVAPQTTSNIGPTAICPALIPMYVKRVVLHFPATKLLLTHIAGDSVAIREARTEEEAGLCK